MLGCYLCSASATSSDRLLRCMGVENIRGIETDLEVYNGFDWSNAEHVQESESYLHLNSGPEAQKARQERMSCPRVPDGQRQCHCSCVHGDPRRAFAPCLAPCMMHTRTGAVAHNAMPCPLHDAHTYRRGDT